MLLRSASHAGNTGSSPVGVTNKIYMGFRIFTEALFYINSLIPHIFPHKRDIKKPPGGRAFLPLAFLIS